MKTWIFLGVFFLSFFSQGVVGVGAPPKKKWVLGLSADYPPFEYREQGTVVGLDVDLARMLTQKLGLELEIQDLDFSALVPALESGRVDFVMSGMAVTPDRAKNIAFSQIYYQSHFALLLRKETSWNPENKFIGMKVGVQLGTTMEKALKSQQAFFPGMKMVSLGKYPLLIQELKIKRLDAVLAEDAQAVVFAQVNPTLKWIPMPKGADSEGGYAIAFSKKKGVGEIQRWNHALEELRSEGQIQKLTARWLKGKSD